MKQPGEVWVLAEQRRGRLLDVSLELVGKGVELSQDLRVTPAAVVIGDRVEQLARELADYGAEKVYLVEDPRLQLYQSDVYANLVTDLINQHQPEIVLVGATDIGRDLAPTIAAKLGTGLTAHCVDLYIEEIEGKPQLIQVVPGWGQNLMIKIVCPEKRPQMATVRPGVMLKPDKVKRRDGEIIRVEIDINDSDFRARTLEMVEEEPAGVPVEAAEVVVAGGWGLYTRGGVEYAEELAQLLGAALGGTRPVVDAGWMAKDRMIGQSGKVVSPRLFISLGASGAIQFTTGFLNAKVILAIDQNPNAPIFEVADIGIVGDLRDVLPCLLEELRAVIKR